MKNKFPNFGLEVDYVHFVISYYNIMCKIYSIYTINTIFIKKLIKTLENLFIIKCT
jgi:hypothetical protein